jgi:segregation and condensation protein B
VTMPGSSAARTQSDEDRQHDVLFDRELEELPPELRWREWMLRVEAVIFASAEPVPRETLARVVGKDCSIELLIDDLREELRDRPYELVFVAGGWQHRTRSRYAVAISASAAPTRSATAAPSDFEAMVLMAVGYFQPVTRGELSRIFGKEVSRDTIGALRNAGLLGSGPRSPTPGAPYTYVTTKQFLSAFGMETLRDLPDIEALEDAGLLARERLLAGELALGLTGGGNGDE